jgi:glyoxylase-like metal-dependent hydrolase (beta-lactamase superfamily II)
MLIRIHHIVTAEAEAPLATSLLNEGVGGRPGSEPIVPYRYRTDIMRSDGRVVEGTMGPMPVWLIEGSSELILVDTGVGDVEEIGAIFRSYGANWLVTRSEGQGLEEGLRRHGLTPHDIDTVILTHLHWDHVGNNELFDRARFLVQRDEIVQALVPPPFGMFYYEQYRHKMTAVLPRVELLDGDAPVADGVSVVRIGGHTPGCMAVMVETSIGRVCLASDIMYNYRNLETNWPIGSFWNLPELMRGYARMRLESDIIVPNHDWEITRHFPKGVIGEA